MKFITEKAQIVDSLQNAAAVAERRQTIPILANLRLKTVNGKLEVTATDLEIQIKTYSDLIEIQEEGETTVSARKMSELCRSLPEGENVNFSLSNGKLTVSSSNFHADFATISPDDFPEIEINEEQTPITVESSVLKRLLTKTSFSMASQDVRYYLNGMLLEIEGNKINGVATDGHRLAFSSATTNAADLDVRNILPRKAVLELSKLLSPNEGTVELLIGASYVDVRSENLSFSSKLIDGKYPNYDAVIPKDNPNKLVIDKQELLNSIKRVSIYASKTTHQIRLKVAGSQLQITSEDLDFANKAEERLTCSYEGEDIEIGFNSRFVIDMLNNIGSDQVCLEMSAPNRAGIILQTYL